MNKLLKLVRTFLWLPDTGAKLPKQWQPYVNKLEDTISALENEMQDFGYRIRQLELNTDLEDRIRELEDRL